MEFRRPFPRRPETGRTRRKRDRPVLRLSLFRFCYIGPAFFLPVFAFPWISGTGGRSFFLKCVILLLSVPCGAFGSGRLISAFAILPPPLRRRSARRTAFSRFCSGSGFLWSAESARSLFLPGPASYPAGCLSACEPPPPVVFAPAARSMLRPPAPGVLPARGCGYSPEGPLQSLPRSECPYRLRAYAGCSPR